MWASLMTNQSGSLRTSERRFHGDDECHGISVFVANVQGVSPDDEVYLFSNICKEGGLRFHKFTSNSKIVMGSLQNI